MGVHPIFACLLSTLVLSRALPDDSFMHPRRFSDTAEEEEHESAEFWMKSAQETLASKIKDDQQIVGEAKNVILYLGDGWGIPTLTAARILKGQEVDQDVKWGEEASLHVDTFPFSGLSKTFCSDLQTGESACTATAYLGGTKANAKTIGVTPAVKEGDCAGQRDESNHVASILAWAQAAGKSTGFITTTKITDASPTGTFAHTSYRDWECDADVEASNQDPESCHDIAKQLIQNEPGKSINVILGGGRMKFLPTNVTDWEGNPGQRHDNRHLIDEWIKEKEGRNAVYLNSGKDLKNVDASKTDYLMGLFATDHIAWYHDLEKHDDPGLPEMVEKAIEILSKNPKGFFLFVEGGRIDDAHHGNQASRSLWEAIEFDRALKTGDDMTDDKDTLIVVTADHSHTFMVAGYADRGNPIWGYARVADDGILSGTLSYANGPGWKPFTGEQRHDIGKDDMGNLDYKVVPLVPLGSETHGGEDVGIFAKGPFAHFLSGVHEQNYIPHVMGYAACIGDGLQYCSDAK